MTVEIERLREQLTASPLQELSELLQGPITTVAGADEEEARRIAYTAARALGECLLFGIPPERIPRQIPLDLVRLGVVQATETFHALADQARQLGEQWDTEEDYAVREDLCLDALANRMEAQAVYTGLTHWLLEAAQTGALSDEEFLELSGPLTDALETYDRALREQAELLCTVRNNPMLHRWRTAIADDYAYVMPWWLGPGLEQAAENMIGKAEQDLKRLANRVSPGAEHEPAVVAYSPPRPAFPPQRQAYPAKLVSLRAAARGTAKEVWLVWHDPQGRYRAETRVPHPLTEEHRVTLQFVRHADGAEARELSGALVQLAGVERTIDENGRCSFSARELGDRVSKGAELRLAVAVPGEELTEWLPDSESLSDAERAVGTGSEPESTD